MDINVSNLQEVINGRPWGAVPWMFSLEGPDNCKVVLVEGVEGVHVALTLGSPFENIESEMHIALVLAVLLATYIIICLWLFTRLPPAAADPQGIEP